MQVLKLTLLALTLFSAAGSASADPKSFSEAANKLLPPVLGDFKALPKVRPNSAFVIFEDANGEALEGFNATSSTVRAYRAPSGEEMLVALVITRSDAAAFSLFTNLGCDGPPGAHYATVAGLETSSCISPVGGVRFAKGPVYVALGWENRPQASPNNLSNTASLLANTLDKGEGDIPALVKHLPGWENGNLQALYAVSPKTLGTNIQGQQIFEAISFEGGVEAASAHYGPSQLVILEFNTPQLATDNNQRIVAKIQELRSQGQPAPSGYRRVGNYAVLVFGAPDEQAANQLIDQVKYQQVVQWLGHNPFSYEEATREFTETTLGVFVSVVKTSGLALLACLAVGGFFGTLLFRFRRAQQRGRDEFADSEAMLRLNLDNLTPENDPERLLGRGNS